MQTVLLAAIALPGVAGTGLLAFAVVPAALRRRREASEAQEPLQIVFEDAQREDAGARESGGTTPGDALERSDAAVPEQKKRARLFGFGGIAAIARRGAAPVATPANGLQENSDDRKVSENSAGVETHDLARQARSTKVAGERTSSDRVKSAVASAVADAAVISESRSDVDRLGTLSFSAGASIESQESEAQPSLQRFAESEAAAIAMRREQLDAARAADAERAAAEAEEQRAAEERERLTRAAEAEAAARGEAWTKQWYIRLDPDLVEPDERERMLMVSGLGLIRGADWVKKLLLLVLEQEQSERVRARAIGALARAGHVEDPVPFESAAERSDVEQSAVVQAIGSFARDRDWAKNLLERLMSAS